MFPVQSAQEVPTFLPLETRRTRSGAGIFSSTPFLFLNIWTLERLEAPLMRAELHVCALRRDASAARAAQQGLRFLKPDLEIGPVSVGRPRVDSGFTSSFLVITWSDVHQG